MNGLLKKTVATRANDSDPRTVIVSWHWPPSNRASAGVLGTLFSAAPPGVFRVVTRSFPEYAVSDRRATSADLDARVPPTFVPWPSDDQAQPTWTQCGAVFRTIHGMVSASCRVARDWGATRILAVYPHRYSLLAGVLASRQLNLPLVLYMHDLFAEAMAGCNLVKRAAWKLVDRIALNQAWMVMTPTEGFSQHYAQRGVSRCWVLPHTVSQISVESTPPQERRSLHFIYCGAIYEPHEDAALSFIRAIEGTSARATFLSPPSACKGLLGRMGARWVSHAEVAGEIDRADVGVVFLGAKTPCPEEVHVCFPTKILDYLRAERPILAVVPKGCFVDRFVRSEGIGLCAEPGDEASIRHAMDQLLDVNVRRSLAQSGKRALDRLQSDVWMRRMIERLRVGPAHATSHPTGTTEHVSASSAVVAPT